MPFKKHNGGSEAGLELDHELPPAGPDDESASRAPGEGGKTAQLSVAEMEAELEKARVERAAYLDRAARLQAEFDNFRKRNAKQQQEYREYALAEALTTLLPILDSLDRALKTNAVSVEDFRSGIELIDKQFHDALAKLGVQPVPAEGELFDPNLHQAVERVQTGEADDMTILGEFQRGYNFRGKLLRPSMVRVAVRP